MQIYLVGGAVRDRLLGMEVTESDWLVTGACPADLIGKGFIPVGKFFPVFLHPETKEEYALARTETKIAAGHHGFACTFNADISLEQDLQRRDLTINAMAQDGDGRVIDPYGGMTDLHNRVIRHVSAAFVEDPLRVFRVARFAARFADLGFTIAAETTALMRNIVASGELATLSAERVWQETVRALSTTAPHIYFATLYEIGALDHWFPELQALWGIPQRKQYHPEIDTGVHVMLALQQVARITTNTMVRFAVLVHDLGKGVTPEAMLPSHRGHEKAGIPLVQRLSQRLKVPGQWQRFAEQTCRYHLLFHQAFSLRPQTLIDLFTRLNAVRQPENLEHFLLACMADARGRTGFEQAQCPQTAYLQGALQAVRNIDVPSLLSAGLAGKQLVSAIHQQRIAALVAYRQSCVTCP